MPQTAQFNTKISFQKHKKMADEIAKICPISQNVYDAFCQSERELFVPQGMSMHAYKLDALPLVANQWISSPLTVAKMTEALTCKGADSVLEIGCGSGYQALILSKVIRRVFTIERIERLLKEARERFKTLGITNIHTRFDDGQNGWREFAPYDRILFSASTPEVPQKLFEQLKVGGILVAPIEKGEKQIITRFIKTEEGIRKEALDNCLFVPVKDGREF
ncbi:protein-L-isoaspartate(D-aspartate) O-methyltransferase [Sulfurospirillum diekertiae]|jgi:protein-L-isoaspartate(D-aspartate) O-methyltransferase|uniref:Protein-L-isoaspartate O-methyltransferase n=1 Tax=Sulfurospirillum diekertiae TaxID=1854492 RepID=A0A290HRI2_9BACT|nr:protein-L-isoaspartate(D-aspartate) O-methyltransferase [Sulfurospirillum diekertiae]ATB68210.1 protein-L-isoaspartate O-methyltransferase [Sulfurospirillum diekertiae]QIR76076.1 protein-L-isoaspartate(D-aspartate) O-methyltransferase [Sulfurospirillum diekertiae]QIR78712.1 protein-L-isoaspartate(D-aspartate) O-methyltransferase [Sulfurospirillum diekertiae]